jgi:hypothetical protein
MGDFYNNVEQFPLSVVVAKIMRQMYQGGECFVNAPDRYVRVRYEGSQWVEYSLRKRKYNQPPRRRSQRSAIQANNEFVEQSNDYEPSQQTYYNANEIATRLIQLGGSGINRIGVRYTVPERGGAEQLPNIRMQVWDSQNIAMNQ